MSSTSAATVLDKTPQGPRYSHSASKLMFSVVSGITCRTFFFYEDGSLIVEPTFRQSFARSDRRWKWCPTSQTVVWRPLGEINDAPWKGFIGYLREKINPLYVSYIVAEAILKE